MQHQRLEIGNSTNVNVSKLPRPKYHLILSGKKKFVLFKIFGRKQRNASLLL